MRLTPADQSKLLLSVAGMIARDRRERGVLLNEPEAVALLSCWVIEGARDGRRVVELMDEGRRVLRRDEVMEGVPELRRRGAGRGDVPGRAQARDAARADLVIPGEVMCGAGDIELNAGRTTRERARSSTAATGRSRSARTFTSPTSTTRSSSTAARRRDSGSTFPRGRRRASSRGRRGASGWWHWRAARRCPVCGCAREDRSRAVRVAVRPDGRRPDAAGRHGPVARGRGGPLRRGRRGGVRRRQDDPRVDGAGRHDVGAGRTGPRHHERRRARPRGDRALRRRSPGRAHRRARESRQSRHLDGVDPALRIGPTTDIVAGEGRS